MPWICSNAQGAFQDRVWHLAAPEERRGERTGKVLARFHVAACTRKTLGAAYGSTLVQAKPAEGIGERICVRCEKIHARGAVSVQGEVGTAADAEKKPAPGGWGKPYGSDPYLTPHGAVLMFRKGQRVRFFTPEGAQIGPEQRNVAPAVVFALSQGWRSANPKLELLRKLGEIQEPHLFPSKSAKATKLDTKLAARVKALVGRGKA